jgi:hypothetical protein
VGQGEEELAAHYGPEGPVRAASQWLDLVLSGRLPDAWQNTDPELRLVLAQAWLWANRERLNVKAYDREEAASALAGLTFEHDLWPAYEETQVQEAREKWGESTTRIGALRVARVSSRQTVSWCFSRLRGGEILTLDGPTLLDNVIPVLMRSMPEGWLVAGFSDQRPQPGWPPSAPVPPILE